MGGAPSSFALPRASPDMPYFTLMFKTPQTIRLALADQDTMDATRRACFSAVDNLERIEFEGRMNDNSYKVRFADMLFAPASDRPTALLAKQVATRLLHEYHALGWRLITSSDLTRPDGLGTWFFHRECIERKPARFICLGLSSTDSLQLVGDFDDTLKAVLKNAVEISYGPGLQDERRSSLAPAVKQSNFYEIKLRGTPWAGNVSREDDVWARRLLLQVIRMFTGCGFRFYGTVNLKGTADSLFFVHEQSETVVNEQNVQLENKKHEHSDDNAHYCMISLDRKDRMTLIDCPSQIVDCTRNVIIAHWKGGLQDEYKMEEETESRLSSRRRSSAMLTSVGGVREFKMKGYPWWADGADTVATRKFLTILFRNILKHNYAIVSSIDVSRNLDDKAVFLLRSHTSQVAHDLPLVCVSMHGVDKMRLTNNHDVTLLEALRNTIQATWPYGVEQENTDYYGSYEWTLKNDPWSNYGVSNKQMIARALMCFIIRAFMQCGWAFIAAADISAKHVTSNAGTDFSSDVDSWFFVDVSAFQNEPTKHRLAD